MNRTKTRILLCSSSMDGGGSEKQLLYLLKSLDRTRFDVFLYLLYPTGSLLPEVPDDIEIFSFWENRIAPRFNWPGRIYRSQVQHLRDVLLRNQIEVVYDRLYHMALLTGPAADGLPIGRASTIVSPPSLDFVRNEKRWVRQKKHRLRESYLNADRLLAVGAATADDAASFYQIPRESLRVVTSPIDIDRFTSLSESDWDGPNLAEDRKHIISVGRLSDEKGHRYLIQAIAEYRQNRANHNGPDVALHLLGEGVLRRELESLVAAHSLEGTVFFYGHRANPFALLRKCDLFVLPSLYEGLPNAVLEAMACRVPVLATNTAGGAGELFRKSGLGSLVPPANASALADSIRDRFLDPEPWMAKLEAGHRYVVEQHDLSNWTGEISEILASIKKPSSH